MKKGRGLTVIRPRPIPYELLLHSWIYLPNFTVACYNWSFANLPDTGRTKPQIAGLAIKMPSATWGHPGAVDHVLM